MHDDDVGDESMGGEIRQEVECDESFPFSLSLSLSCFLYLSLSVSLSSSRDAYKSTHYRSVNLL